MSNSEKGQSQASIPKHKDIQSSKTLNDYLIVKIVADNFFVNRLIHLSFQLYIQSRTFAN